MSNLVLHRRAIKRFWLISLIEFITYVLTLSVPIEWVIVGVNLTFWRNGRISTFFVLKHKYYCLLSPNEENTIPLRFIGFLSRVPQ